MAGNTSQPGASALLRGIAILKVFDDETPALTAGDICARTGLASSTVGRLLVQLVEAGLLERDRHKRFRIGTAAWEIGLHADLALTLRERALPYLLDLYEVTRENIHLAVRSGNEALYVDRVTGTKSVPTVSRMGGRLPLHTTGVGKVLLASQDDRFIADYVNGKLNRPTPYSITSIEGLYADLDQVRKRGYALTKQEMTLGSVSVAVPVTSGQVTHAALGVVVHVARSDVTRQVAALRRATEGIAASLRTEPRPDPAERDSALVLGKTAWKADPQPARSVHHRHASR